VRLGWCLAIGLVPVARAIPPRVDVLIRGGSVYDGTGAPPRRVDIGVTGGRIAFVGDAAAQSVHARTVISAAGLVVTPGFIDPHTHTDRDLDGPTTRGLAPFLLQGVTTVVVGNDGAGSPDVRATRDRWTRAGIGTNVVMLVGEGAVRARVMGMAARAPTAAELDRMKRLVRQAMREGAVGLSTGLYYAPGSYASTEEIIALAQVAREQGGLYDSHIRDESSYTIGLLGAIDEAIRIGREAKTPVHIAHIKALGVDVWGQSRAVIDRIEAARAAGQEVTADQYPYTASGTSVGAALLPRWAEAGGRDSLRRRIDDSATRARLVPEMRENLRRRGGANSLLLTSGKGSGRRLDQLAERAGRDPIDQALSIIRDGDAGVASFNMNEEDVERFMKADFVVTGSDGSDGHPRKYGTFPRKLADYSLKRGVIPFAAAIASSSGRTATIYRLDDRGVVRVGAAADLVVLDSTRLADRSTYEAPREPAVGVRFVLVNGVLAVREGKPTGALAGRVLARK
jgi:N-acyl-D-aspartate/D-glutamate deacylase